MRTTSLVNAKAHLSELVDAAEHHGQRVIILRHGKPAAAIVPLRLAGDDSAPRTMSRDQAEAFLADIASSAPKSKMTVAQALGRDRLDADQ